MCNPLVFGCSATHFPLLLDSAVERLNQAKGEVNLSKGAVNVLYKHGSAHKAEFERALKDKDNSKLEQLSKSLQKRMEAALADSKQTDPSGHPYNPQRIDGDAMQKALQAASWTP
jgi:hypothetical protein